MTKPHEEEWEIDADGDVRRLNKKGVRTSLVLVRAAGNNEARARLASKAPKMARALLADMVLWDDGQWHDEFRCPALTGAQCAEWCASKREALREAGVLE